MSSPSDPVAPVSLVDACERLARAELTSAVLVQASMDRIAQVDADIRAWAHVGAREALLQRARESDARRAAGAARSVLEGVPVSIKDSQHVVGMPTAFGSVAASPVWPDQPSPLVAMLESAGAIPLGKTALPEFSWKATTESPLTGVTRNPRYPAFSPGGSSGGAVASLAQGACLLATGTDAAGSVRIPAAFTATAGFKPSDTLALATAAVEGFRRIGHWGLHAGSTADLRLAWGALYGRAEAPQRLRWATIDPATRMGPGARRFLERAVSRLTERVGPPSAVASPDWPLVNATIHDLYLRGCHETVEKIDPGRRALVDPGLLAFAARGAQVDAERLARALARQVQVRSALDALFEDVDLLVLPTVAFEPPLGGDESPSQAQAGDWLDWAYCTALTNLGGHPSLSLPGELDGVPFGLQLVGRRGADAGLLALGERLEQQLSLMHGSPARSFPSAARTPR